VDDTYFLVHVANSDIYRVDVPTASTFDTHDNHASANTNGVCVDIVASRVYWADNQRSIVRSAYDGSDEENVIDFPASGAGTNIYGISLGR
jgi:hypothetical protein